MNFFRKNKIKAENKGFWSFSNDREWSPVRGGDLESALATLADMKEKYGDQFQFIIEDLEERGETKADGTETSRINIKIVVEPRNKEIESHIEALGLIYIE